MDVVHVFQRLLRAEKRRAREAQKAAEAKVAQRLRAVQQELAFTKLSLWNVVASQADGSLSSDIHEQALGLMRDFESDANVQAQVCGMVASVAKTAGACGCVLLCVAVWLCGRGCVAVSLCRCVAVAVCVAL